MLTEKQKKDIVKLYKAGHTIKSACMAVGISYPSAKNILDDNNITVRKDWKRKYKVNDKYFNQWNNDMAYILGFLLSDCCVERSKTLRINISLKDRPVLNFIRSKICPKAKIKVRCYKNGFKSLSLLIHSKNLIENMDDYGIQFPKSIRSFNFPIPPAFLNDFIRGVLDADSYVGKAFVYTTTCQPNAVFLYNYFNVGNIKNDKNYLRWVTCNKYGINKILSVYDTKGFSLPRRLKTIKKLGYLK